MNRAHLMSEMLLWHTARKEDEGKMLIEDFFMDYLIGFYCQFIYWRVKEEKWKATEQSLVENINH